jgi:hypothetical protein
MSGKIRTTLENFITVTMASTLSKIVKIRIGAESQTFSQISYQMKLVSSLTKTRKGNEHRNYIYLFSK